MSDKEVYLEFRKTYLMFMEIILKDIENGKTSAAEQYQHLEDTWKGVAEWYGEHA